NSFHRFTPCYEPERRRTENLSPQKLKISAPRASGWIRLSNLGAEHRRFGFCFNLYWREPRKHVAVTLILLLIPYTQFRIALMLLCHKIFQFPRKFDDIWS